MSQDSIFRYSECSGALNLQMWVSTLWWLQLHYVIVWSRPLTVAREAVRLNIDVKRLWDQLVTLWPQVNFPMLNRPSFLFLRGVRQASHSNPHADLASPRTSTQWLSQETYCMARVLLKVSLPLPDLIQGLIVFLFCTNLSLKFLDNCLSKCVFAHSHWDMYYCMWLYSQRRSEHALVMAM